MYPAWEVAPLARQLASAPVLTGSLETQLGALAHRREYRVVELAQDRIQLDKDGSRNGVDEGETVREYLLAIRYVCVYGGVLEYLVLIAHEGSRQVVAVHHLRMYADVIGPD